MKKLTKLLPCLLLSAALAVAIVTSLPTSAQAVDNSSISAQFAPGTTDAVCPVCNKMVTWKELTAKKTYSKDGDHYYLAQDLRWTESQSLFHIPSSADGVACLHLNGKNIDSIQARVLDGGKGTLNVVGNGTVSSGKSGVGAILSTWGGETVNLYGGTYKSLGGNAIYVVGTVNIYDPVIIDASRVQGSKLAGCIYTERKEAVINFHGGQLIGAEIAGNGGAVCVNKGTFTMSGGTIQGGKSSTSGGNLSVIEGAKFTMTGGTIKGGSAVNSGGNVHVSNASFTMSAGTIEGGKAQNGGNFRIVKTQKFTITGGTIKGGISEGGNGGNFYANESAIKLSGCTVEGGTSDVSGGNVVLSASTLTMTSGQIKGGTANQGGNIYASSESSVTLSGGTVDGGVSEVGGGNIYLSASSVTLSGGKVTNGKVTAGNTGGGNIYATTESNIKMTSGTISGGTAKHGGNIYIYRGKMNMSGGKIEGGVSNDNKGGSVYLYGWEEYKCILNVSGGTLEGGDLYIAGPDARISISDGKVLSKVEGKTENLTLSGGQISQPLEDALPENMDMFETDDGSFILYDKDSVAMVGKDMFKSLADAMKKATLDNKLILLADVSNELVISGKKAIDLNGHTVKAIRVEDSAQLKLYNHKQGKIESLTGPMAQVSLENGQYSATVGTITNTGTWNIDSGIYADIVNNGKLVISGGEFTGKLEGSNIAVSGGVFGHDVSALLSENFNLRPIDGGRFIACDPTAAAAVEGKAYPSLQAALDSEPSGKGVYLLRDCDEQVTYEIKGKNNVTIMTNGFTLTELTVGAGANLTVNPSGGGKVTTLHQYVRVHAQDNNFAAAFDVIYNHIDIALGKGIYCEIRNDATLTLSEGQFTGPVSGGKLVISGGEFTGGLGACESIVITGGTFPSDVSQWVSEGYACQKSGNGYTVGVPAPFNPVPYILIGGGGLLVIILVVAILLTRPSRKTKTTETKEEI